MQEPLFLDKLPASFYANNRKNLTGQMPNDSLVIIAAGRPPRKTADESYPFFANRNFTYLTGIEQENALFLLRLQGGVGQEILFLPERDPMQERWNGRRLDQDMGSTLSGCRDIREVGSFAQSVRDCLTGMDGSIWLDQSAENGQAADLYEWVTKTFPDWKIEDLSPYMTDLRMIKQPAEIKALRKAVSLTARGLRAVEDALRPGCYEYELCAAFQQTLAAEGILEPAFPTIAASAENSLCLHHMQPYRRIECDDIVQLDAGAAVSSICADISRVYNSNGAFTSQQQQIFQLVLECQKSAFETIRPGILISDINRCCQDTAREGLIKLGLLGYNDSITRHFWHSVSHHLGFDVHDLSVHEKPLAPGMVLTVEPGIYVEAWNFGIRLEDDILITETGCENLSAEIPK